MRRLVCPCVVRKPPKTGFLASRPKFKPVMLTNIVYSVYRTSFPLGISQGLPDYLTRNHNLITFEKNPNTWTLYKDNLCFFKCLAFHQTGSIKQEKLTKKLYKQWITFADNKHLRNTQVTFSSIPYLEKCFNTNVNV